MSISLRFGDPLGWAYDDDVTGGPPPLHFTPVGPAEVCYWPAPRPVTQQTPSVSQPIADMFYAGRDPGDPSTWRGRPWAPADGMAARFNASGRIA